VTSVGSGPCRGQRRALLRLSACALPGCATGEPAPARSTTVPPASDLVLVRVGTLPIVISAPHGGRQPVPGASPRNLEGRPKNDATWVASEDPRTDRLAIRIADELHSLTGRHPSLVVAKFARRYIDANRPPEIAYDSPASRPTYDAYHGWLRHFVDDVRARFPAGLLIDIHGQHKDPDVLMRGTLNGRTVTALLARAGPASIIGADGLFGQLQSNGFKVFPSNDVPPAGKAEDAGYNGGYTVIRYGSHRPDGIDAVQFEYGSRYRQAAVVDDWAKASARAIAAFHRRWLSAPQRS
jgi:hypothetical protein